MTNDDFQYSSVGSHGGGIHTVLIDGRHVHITELDHAALCEAWAKRQREINELYSVNKQANEGWRGVVLRLIGVVLPERPVRLGFVRKSELERSGL